MAIIASNSWKGNELFFDGWGFKKPAIYLEWDFAPLIFFTKTVSNLVKYYILESPMEQYINSVLWKTKSFSGAETPLPLKSVIEANAIF